MARSSFGQADNKVMVSRKLRNLTAPDICSVTRLVTQIVTYQFCKTSLSLLENGLRTLVHSLLLLFQHLRILALLQALEDLPQLLVPRDWGDT
jgi:hypothetical protein